MEIDNLIDEYVEKFGENVPIAAIRCKTDEELRQMLQKSIESGIPIAIEYEKDSAY